MCHYTDLLQFVDCAETFTKFVKAIIDDFHENFNDWENTILADFFIGMGSWIHSMEGYYINMGLEMPKNINWNFIAQMLLAETIFESDEQALHSIGCSLQDVNSKKSFERFIDRLAEDVFKNADHGYNQTVDSYLNGIILWIQSMDEYYKQLGESIPDDINWEVMGMILVAASAYE